MINLEIFVDGLLKEECQNSEYELSAKLLTELVNENAATFGANFVNEDRRMSISYQRNEMDYVIAFDVEISEETALLKITKSTPKIDIDYWLDVLKHFYEGDRELTFVEWIEDEKKVHPNPWNTDLDPNSPSGIAKELLKAGYQNKRLEAIRILMDRTGLSLKEAKDVIEATFPSIPKPTTVTPQTTKQTSGGCYIATAIYGSYNCPEVWTLRRFRDNTLATTWYGRTFICLYYAISPTLVKWFGHTELFKKMWKGKLDHLVDSLNAKGVKNTPYEDKRW